MIYFRKWLQNKPTLIAACLGAGIALASGTASAVQATKWNYAQDSQFVVGSTIFAGNGNAGTQTDSIYELSWGAAGGNFQNPDPNSLNNRSALTIGKDAGANRTGGGPVGGSLALPDGSKTVNTTFGNNPLFVNGEVGLGVTFTHWNNPLDGDFKTLTHGRVKSSLTLQAILPNGPYPGAVAPQTPIFFDFEFRETPNGGPCAGGLATPCPDLFGIVGNPNLNVAFQYLDPVNNVNENYLASIFVADQNGNPAVFTTLNAGECQALGLANQCQGFRTAEGAATTIQFAFAITTQPIPVPEPGTLPLFGLALAWLGFASRRRSS